jgi:hypothetical protein
MARHHHHRHVELAVAGPFLEQRDAIGIGHPDVEQDQVGTPGLARRPRLGGIFGELDVVTLVAQDLESSSRIPTSSSTTSIFGIS